MNMEPEFVKALLALRSEIGPVLKGETAKGKDGKPKYKYPDLAGVHNVIDGPMAKHGFVVFHRFQEGANNGEAFMETHLVHEKGELVSTLPLWMKQLEYMNFYQSMGSAITYLRRYAIMALLGIPAEDDDGQSAAQKPAQRQNGNGQKVTPRNTEDAKRAFLKRESYHMTMPSVDGKPNVTLWTDKFCELLPLTGSGPQIDKLATDNGATLDWMRENHPELSARITKALQDAHKAVQTINTMAAE